MLTQISISSLQTDHRGTLATVLHHHCLILLRSEDRLFIIGVDHHHRHQG